MAISKNVFDVREFIRQSQQKTSVNKGLVEYFNLFIDTYIELKRATKR